MQLYLSQQIIDEIQAEATRLDRSLSWIAQQAWRLARKTIGQEGSPMDCKHTGSSPDATDTVNTSGHIVNKSGTWRQDISGTIGSIKSALEGMQGKVPRGTLAGSMSQPDDTTFSFQPCDGFPGLYGEG